MVFIKKMYVVALVLVVITISDSTYHPLLIIFSISDWYFSIFVIAVFGKNIIIANM